AKAGSYSPYSNFRVGAALLAPGGVIIKGANIENSSYGGTICAERTAMVKAASENIREFVALAVTSDVASPVSPCGICRQFVREFCALEMPVLLIPANYGNYGDGKGEILETTLGDLLPHSFGPAELKLPRI
ncbi:cytidine deaminase, partial [Dacryopinax primogenitus]